MKFLCICAIDLGEQVGQQDGQAGCAAKGEMVGVLEIDDAHGGEDQTKVCLLYTSLDQVGGHTAGRDGGAAAEGEELDVHDHVVLDLQVHAHDIAALRCV